MVDAYMDAYYEPKPIAHDRALKWPSVLRVQSSVKRDCVTLSLFGGERIEQGRIARLTDSQARDLADDIYNYLTEKGGR